MPKSLHESFGPQAIPILQNAIASTIPTSKPFKVELIGNQVKITKNGKKKVLMVPLYAAKDVVAALNFFS